jgi:hypothetical protein
MKENDPEQINKTGRPPVLWDEEHWKRINAFLTSRADGATIARYYGVHPDTLYAKVVEKYGELYGITTFSAYAQLKKEEGCELLRRTQFDIAMGGNVSMLIWLGKQYLDQRDTSDFRLGGGLQITPFQQLLMDATAELIEKEPHVTSVIHPLNETQP